MKVLLISGNTAESPYPVYPIGISIVANTLRHAGYEVCLFDFLQQGQSHDRLRERLLDFSPDAVGISIRNIDNVNSISQRCYLDQVRMIVDDIREVTSAPVIIGGSGFSLMPEAVLAHVRADYGIKGEGEVAFDRLLQKFNSGQRPDDRIFQEHPLLPGPSIPSADYDSDILSFYRKHSHLIPIQTKRGCARKCIYCTYPVLEGAEIRPRPVSTVVDEMEMQLRENTQDGFFIVDSLFNDAQGTYRTLIHEMHRRGVTVPWTAFFGPSRELDDEIVALMRKTGLRTAEVGADAMSDTTLAGLAKGFRFADVVTTNELFLRHDITTAHFYTVGGPGETPETIEEGIANVLSLRRTVNFFFLGIRIIPGTPLMERSLEEGLWKRDQDPLKPVFYLSPMIDKERVQQRLEEAFADFPHCVFPPDKMDDQLQFLFRQGYLLETSYRLLNRE